MNGFLNRMSQYETELDNACNNLAHFSNTCVKLKQELEIIHENIDDLRNFIAELACLVDALRHEPGSPENPIVIED